MTIEEDVYNKHKNLKIAAQEIGIKWQNLYCRLRKQGVQVIGDKSRYGSVKDRLAVMAESEFFRLVPEAKNMNSLEWQSKCDFCVGNIKVDVKCSMPRILQKKSTRQAWAFSFKKQSLNCDFIVCFCMNNNKETDKILVVPKEFFEGLQTVSISIDGYSKWHDYEVSKEDLREFFVSL